MLDLLRAPACWVFYALEDDLVRVQRMIASGTGGTFRPRALHCIGGEAWPACRAAMRDYERGRYVRQSRRTVEDALSEWLERIMHSLKPSLAKHGQNYIAFYVVPHIGRRLVQEVDGRVCDALYDRFFALWVLEATSGMRRSELAGARIDGFDFEAGTLRLERTRVVVDGQVVESDGKTENAQRVVVPRSTYPEAAALACRDAEPRARRADPRRRCAARGVPLSTR